MKINIESRHQVQAFIRHVTDLFFLVKKCRPNLALSQQSAFFSLRERHDLVIFPCDKNLGPAVMERERYIKSALTEHLSDSTTYRQLTETQAANRVKAIKRIITQFVKTYHMEEDERRRLRLTPDGKFLTRCLAQVHDPYSYFYLLAKVHKQPLRTRPIVSCYGCVLHGVGRWLDCQLQLICKDIQYRISSSAALVTQLKQLDRLPKNARLFTCDAQSMYTNIDTKVAIKLIADYLRSPSSPCYCLGIGIDAVIKALEIVMSHNVFKFGDTYWLQQRGTAMGTPPAPMFATLFFAILEMGFIHLFKTLLTFYGRYIDDGFGIWTPHDPSTARENFKKGFNELSCLEWDFSPLSTSIDFLDIHIEIVNGTITTRLYEKALNLYLYLPPHSAHPPGMVRGLVHGMVMRIFRLSSDPFDALTDCKRFGQRLVARGYSAGFVLDLINKSIKTWSHDCSPVRRPSTACTAAPLFLHVPYHPMSPASTKIQAMFRQDFFPLESNSKLGCMFSICSKSD
jgi:hypothetical protein